jgi:hypothetical protein
MTVAELLKQADTSKAEKHVKQRRQAEEKQEKGVKSSDHGANVARQQ